MTTTRETQTVTVAKTVTTSTTCDGCGLVVDGEAPEDWVFVGTRHHDWGNDSHESCEVYDACSPACYFTVMSQFVIANSGSKTAEMDGDIGIAFAARILEYLRCKRLGE